MTGHGTAWHDLAWRLRNICTLPRIKMCSQTDWTYAPNAQFRSQFLHIEKFMFEKKREYALTLEEGERARECIASNRKERTNEKNDFRYESLSLIKLMRGIIIGAKTMLCCEYCSLIILCCSHCDANENICKYFMCEPLHTIHIGPKLPLFRMWSWRYNLWRVLRAIIFVLVFK